jgi:hypothetical protein
MGDWTAYDPNFRKEEPRYFPSDSVDRRTEWQQVNSGFDLYEPKSGACQLGISVSYFNYCVRHDPSAGDNGAGDDCLQYAGFATVVECQEAPPSHMLMMEVATIDL